MLSAGLSLRVARDLLSPGASYESILAEAATAPPGCDGLIFLPHLTGERCPYADPLARGGWIGLTSRHTRAHMLRATVEGITFSMGQIIQLARSCGVAINRLRVTGGGNRSQFWRELQAQVFGCEIATTNAEEGGGALGAALLAATGIGLHKDIASACRQCISETSLIVPTRGPDDALRAAMDIHDSMYHKLRGTWTA
jgi:xylulokinase